MTKRFIYQFSGVFFMVELVILFFASSCCNTLPRVTTGQATEIERTTAKCGGVIEDDGGGSCDCSERGVCWSTNPSPTISDSRTSDGVGIGSFTSNLTQLTTNTPYHVRAYATNAQGTSYGTEITFTTKDITLPALETSPVTSITKITAVSGGTNIDDGGSPIIAKGVCWGKTENPDLTNKTNDGSGSETFTSNITELQPGTSYFVRAYATNSKGTNYGLNKPFTTTCGAPTATTNLPSALSTTSATLNGTVNANGNNCSTVVVFEYGTTTSYGSTIAATPGTVTGITNTAVSATITGLTPGQTYHYRVKATNSGGITDGSDVTVTPVCTAPSATTNAASGVGTTTATLNGIVNANNSSTSVTFEYGTTTSYGSTIAATPSPVTGNSNTAVTAIITGLTPGQTYHYRVKAVNCGGTTYGLDQPVGMGCTAPSATTNLASAVGTTSATLNGNVNANNSATTVTFEYGTTTSYGTTKTAAQSPVTGNINTAVSATVTGLTPGQTYHYRVIGTNCGGISNGSDQTFTTGCTVPSATTDPASPVGTTTATLKGTVNANNSSTTVTFEYGLTTSYGSVITATPSPVTGSSNTAVSANITGLSPCTIYYYRVKAVNCGGSTYSSGTYLTTTCAANSFVQHLGIVQTNINLSTVKTMGQITINPTVSGKVIVSFDGQCWLSPGDRIVLAASNTASWGISDGHTEVEAIDANLNLRPFSHTRVYDVSAGSRTFYAVAQNYVETDGTGIASIYGSLTVQFIPASTSIVGFTGISKTSLNLASETTVGAVTINPTVSGKAIVKFDGFCISSPGDRIVLAASNTTSWGVNDGCVQVEAANSDIDQNSFSHTRVYDISAGSRTFYAVAQNYVETAGTGIASIYGSLTVHFVPTSGIVVAFSGIQKTLINMSNSTVLGQVTINPSVSGKVLVQFDGVCISSPGDRIVLSASNTTSWSVNDGNIGVEAVNSNVDKNSFSHTRVYTVSAGSSTFFAIGHNYVETAGTGIASVYGTLTVKFFPNP